MTHAHRQSRLSPLSPRLKIERAEKHILELNKIAEELADFDSYSVSVEVHAGKNHLRFTVNENKVLSGEASVVIGDAIHNLRSTLDVLYRQTMIRFGGTPDKRTTFPIRKSREELETALGKLEKHVALDICNLIRDGVRPYPGGNYAIWALHHLDILDKHQFIIPVFAMWAYRDLRVENDEHLSFGGNCHFITDSPSRLFPVELEGNLTVKNKGHTSAVMLFPPDVPCEGQRVVPVINELKESVSCVVEAFESL
jgi:hypothetical protein